MVRDPDLWHRPERSGLDESVVRVFSRRFEGLLFEALLFKRLDDILYDKSASMGHGLMLAEKFDRLPHVPEILV